MEERKDILLLAADTGYSAVKCAFLNDEGKLETFKFPTAVAYFAFLPTGMREKEPIAYKDGYYFVGEEALNYSNYVLPTQTEEFSVLYAPLLLYHAYRLKNIKPERVCLSVAIHEFDREIVLRDVFTGSEEKGEKRELLKKYVERFEVNGEEFEQKVYVLPQGLGIWFDAGKPDNCVIVDIGYRTIDVVVINEGKIEPFTTGIPDRGTITMASLLRDYVAEQFGVNLSVAEAERILRTGKLTVKGKEEDLSEVIEKLKQTYAMKTLVDAIHTPAIRPFWERHGNIIVAGGGAYFLPELVKKGYGLTVPEKPEYSNVRGFIKRLAESK